MLILTYFDSFAMTYSILANSANTNCRPFQVKINCSKFKIDGLQQGATLLCQFLCL